jgi:uncharacterized membrane protein
MTYQRILTLLLLPASSGGLSNCNSKVKEERTEQLAQTTESTSLDSSFTALMQRKKENTTTYTTSTESATMEISIVQGSCADVMSGQLYTHAVTVRIKRGTDKDFKTFKGCGTFVN